MTLEERRKARKEYYLKRKKELADRKARGERINLSFKEENPWYEHYNAARKRCTNPKEINYRFYGERGIKFKMNVQDVMDLWIRDNADTMERPSLDRIDSNKNYEFDNCRFIELSENSARANRGKRRK